MTAPANSGLTAPSLSIGVFGARGIPSTYSGYETFLTVLLPEMAARGHDVTMYCRRGEVPVLDSYAGVRCVQLPALASKQLSTLSHGWVAAVRARSARHDAVLVVNVANAGVCLVARALGQRLVLNTDGQEWIRGKWGYIARSVFRLSAHLARWSASALVTDCAAMQRIYRARFKAASTVIPYCWTGIAPSAGSEALARFALERRSYLLIAGRFVPENNIVEMTGAYLATDLTLPLVILGRANYDSPVSRELVELSRQDGRVVLAGHVDDRAHFAALVAGSLVYLHGHSVGGINPSLLEAMGCGARIAALDTPFNREALGEAGDYFRDAGRDLSPLLRDVAAETGQANDRRRTAAVERAMGHFALSDVADAYEALLREVASRPARSRSRISTRWEALHI